MKTAMLGLFSWGWFFLKDEAYIHKIVMKYALFAKYSCFCTL